MDCNTPASLDASLREQKHGAGPRSAATARRQVKEEPRRRRAAAAAPAAAPAAAAPTRSVSSGPPIEGLAAVVEEVWKTRHEWGPPMGLTGLQGRDNEDEAALWCALVTQRANAHHGQRTVVKRSFSEVEVLECLVQLCRGSGGGVFAGAVSPGAGSSWAGGGGGSEHGSAQRHASPAFGDVSTQAIPATT